MKHRGKAFLAGLRILIWTAIAGMAALILAGWLLPGEHSPAARIGICSLGLLAMVFILSFFRDPTPRVPPEIGIVVAPAHGKVDVIDEATELEVVGGRCRRISIFLSVFDVHVQCAPVEGTVTYVMKHAGKFLNALKTESAIHNENVLVGFTLPAPVERKVAVRLIAGLIARRIVLWVKSGEVVPRGERISLIQFGSRVDLYFPLEWQVAVQLGQHVVGGETVLARFGP